MRKYCFEADYTMSVFIEVEAESEEEALDLACSVGIITGDGGAKVYADYRENGVQDVSLLADGCLERFNCYATEEEEE